MPRTARLFTFSSRTPPLKIQSAQWILQETENSARKSQIDKYVLDNDAESALVI
jgi:hypothetical protein